jgi:hypothetical protein
MVFSSINGDVVDSTARWDKTDSFDNTDSLCTDDLDLL